MKARIPEVLLTLTPHIVYPGLHGGIGFPEPPLVPIGEKHIPWDDRHCVGPARASSITQHIGDYKRNGSVRRLIRRHILQPLGKEIVHSPVVSRRAREHLRVSCPAE